MPSHLFKPDRGGRRNEAEVLAAVKDAWGVALVNGFDQVLDESPGTRAEPFRAVGGDSGSAGAWRIRLRDGERLTWLTAPVPSPLDAKGVVAVVSLAMGNGSPLPEATGQFDLLLDDQRLLSFRIVKHTEMWRRGDASFCLDVRRLEAAKPGEAIHLGGGAGGDAFAAFGYGLLRLPAERVKPGQPLRLSLAASSPVPSNRWLQLHKAPALLRSGTFGLGLERVSRRAAHWRVGDYTLLFGDIHSHSGLGRAGEGSGSGVGTPRDNFLFARDVANLDLYALTDHDSDFASGADWELRGSLAQEFYKPGAFVTLPAFEWSSARFGHRGVYYEDPEHPYLPACRDDDTWSPRNATPEDLWKALGELDSDALTIPFHPASARHPMAWDYRNPRFEPAAEIYSCLGSVEATEGHRGFSGGDLVAGSDLRSALAAGVRVGFIASSNSHDGHPGDAQGGGNPAYFHHRGSGRVGLYAKDFNRAGVFEALRARRVYATTGEPMFLDFRLNDHLMGSELRSDQVGRTPQLLVRAIGTCEIETVQVLCNGRVVGIQFGDGLEEGLVVRDSSFDPGQPRTYYARVVQRDGEVAWSSPIWVA